MITVLEKEQRQQGKALQMLVDEMKNLRELLPEKVVDGTNAMETRVQKIETTLELMKGNENSLKNAVVETTEHLRSMCDQMDEDFKVFIEIFEKISENKELVAKLTDYNNNVELKENSGCEQGQGEFTMGVNNLSSSERQENATSPIDLKQSESEGKFSCSACIYCKSQIPGTNVLLTGPPYK